MFHLTKNPFSGTYAIWEVFIVPDTEVSSMFLEGAFRFPNRRGTACARLIDTIAKGPYALGDEDDYDVERVWACSIFASEDLMEVVGIAALEQCDAKPSKPLDGASRLALNHLVSVSTVDPRPELKQLGII